MKKYESVNFKIEKNYKSKKYTISVLISGKNFYSDIPTNIFPEFDSVMYAYIFCVGMIHTAYREEQIMFGSGNKSIFKEINRLQSDDYDDE